MMVDVFIGFVFCVCVLGGFLYGFFWRDREVDSLIAMNDEQKERNDRLLRTMFGVDDDGRLAQTQLEEAGSSGADGGAGPDTRKEDNATGGDK